MNCRVCDSPTSVVQTLPVARHVSTVFAKPTLGKPVQVELYHCPSCNHYQIPDVNDSDYYEDYYMTATPSAKMQELQKEQAGKLHCLAGAKQGNFLEIGCGDGSFLSHMKPLFANVLGVEPSKTFFRVCRQKGFSVINEYLTEKLSFACKFDAFAARQVFEHLTDPLKVLTLIHNQLDDGAVGLIEVPNAQKTLREQRYFDLFTDHVNYFTPTSLARLAAQAGFEIAAIQESFNNDYLEMYLRKKPGNLGFQLKQQADFAFVQEQVKNYSRISAWGAGAKAQVIMLAYPHELKLRHVFDIDTTKWGKYLINCRTKITAPTAAKVNQNDLIIILAVTYQDEISSELRNKYGYRGDILGLEGEPCILST